MNREIKFRYYNISYQKMLYGENILLEHFFKSYKEDLRFQCEVSDIQQYTGLKDKNGKEIYEGDVVKYVYWKGFSATLKIKIREVKFHAGCFGFYEYQRKGDEYFNSEWDVNSLEVIGNIYENPEVMEKV